MSLYYFDDEMSLYYFDDKCLYIISTINVQDDRYPDNKIL